jgi:signal transduction histidine kinase
MVLNLLDNAVKYTPERGEVRVSLERKNGSYLVRVADTGIGIPPEAQPFIFDRFYRVDRGRARTEEAHLSPAQGAGAGLGLAIARWIAEIHGGTLQLESSGPGGSTFVAELPSESS